jgi:hypothetical protein
MTSSHAVCHLHGEAGRGKSREERVERGEGKREGGHSSCNDADSMRDSSTMTLLVATRVLQCPREVICGLLVCGDKGGVRHPAFLWLVCSTPLGLSRACRSHPPTLGTSSVGEVAVGQTQRDDSRCASGPGRPFSARPAPTSNRRHPRAALRHHAG